MPADHPRRLIRVRALPFIALLASCTPAAPDLPAPSAARAPDTAGVCRVGPDDGPPPPASRPRITDRGIGGTGAAVREADRGIGGTGAAGPQVADRGIGGTGIVAVITGFASVCLAGQEVALDPGVPVLIGDRPATAEALRAGQVAVVDAAGTGPSLRARTVAIRYEVSGPVEAADGGSLRVAGQQVAVPAGTLGDRPAPGEWVAVSGLRRPDGVIEATRLDRRPPGDVMVHGRLVRAGGLWRIGALPVRPAPGVPVPDSQDVTVVGVLEGGVLQVEQLAPDLLASDPSALFGVGVSGLLIETYAVVEGDRVRSGQGFSAAAPGFVAAAARRAVLTLERDGGGLRAVNFGTPGSRTAGPAGSGGRGDAAPVPTRQFEPAPVPNRALGPAAGRAGGTGDRQGGPGRRAGARLEPGGSGRTSDGPGFGSAPGGGGEPGTGPGAGGGPAGGPARGR